MAEIVVTNPAIGNDADVRVTDVAGWVATRADRPARVTLVPAR